MKYATAIGYLLLGLAARLGLLLSWPLAWFGWLEPAVWFGFWVLYYDEAAGRAMAE